jgi:nitric oxide reductase subunit B
MFRSQRLAFKYFAAAVTLFGIMVIAGLLSATYYLQDGFLLNKLDFSVAKMLHIDTMIIWLLMGFIGAVHWFLPIELGRETEGIKLAEIMFWIFCAAVAAVAAVFIFVSTAPRRKPACG